MIKIEIRLQVSANTATALINLGSHILKRNQHQLTQNFCILGKVDRCRYVSVVPVTRVSIADMLIV